MKVYFSLSNLSKEEVSFSYTKNKSQNWQAEPVANKNMSIYGSS